MLLSASTERLAEELYRIEQLLLGAVTTPQLGQSSIDGSELTVADEHGEPLGALRADAAGQVVVQPDVKPGPPPAPSVPTAEGDANIIRVTWDGGWAGNGSDGEATIVDEGGEEHLVDLEDRSVAVGQDGVPAQFIEVHASQVEGFVPSQETVAATMVARADGNSTICGPFREAGEYYVCLVARDRFGQSSGPSPVVTVGVPLGGVSDELMGAYVRANEAMRSADGKSRIFYGSQVEDPPDGGFQDGDLWFDSENQNMPHVYSAELSKFVSVADQRVEAVQSAVESMRDDLEGQIEGAAGSRITWSPDEPPVGDAPGKAGDTWFQLQAGRVVGQWAHDGSSWAARPISHEAIASLDLGKATVGELDGGRIKAGSIQADTVLVPGSAGSTVIADGAVTTEKIAAGAITAESGVIGSLDLGKATVGELDGRRIAANTISSEQIAAQAIRGESLEAGAIDGKTITGATVRTSAGFPRVQMDDAGLHAWDKVGRKTFYADQDTGAVSIVGEFMSGQAGQPRVKIDPDDWASIVDTNENGETVNMNGAGIAIEGSEGRGLSIYHGLYSGAEFGRGGAGAIDGPGRQVWRMASIGHTWLRQFEADSNAKSELYLWPQQARLSTQDSGGRVLSEVDMSGGHAAFRKQSAPGGAGSSLQLWDHVAYFGVNDANGDEASQLAMGNGWARLRVGRFYTESATANMGEHKYTGTSSNWAVRYYKGNDWFGEIGSPGGMFASDSFGVVSKGDRELELWGQGCHLRLRRDSSSPHLVSKTVYDRTYSGAANVYITGYGTLGRTSSARKYKADEQVIEPNEFADALLSIPFKSWLDRAELEQWEAFKKHVEEKPGCPVGPDMAECPQGEPRRHIGAVAEDFVDAGLSQFVTFNEFGEPDGLQYDRIGVALIPLVASQRDRISQLEDQATGLAERLEALEAALAA